MTKTDFGFGKDKVKPVDAEKEKRIDFGSVQYFGGHNYVIRCLYMAAGATEVPMGHIITICAKILFRICIFDMTHYRFAKNE